MGMKIVQKCDGLPLAVKTLGSVLRYKKNLHEWENVLKSELWEMKEAEVELFPHLLLSYNELSPLILKRCFSYCSIFPKDFEIDVESLIRDWMALGYLVSDDKCEMEIEGRKLFDVLATRSLFQDFEKDKWGESVESCKMHDIVDDFAQFLRKKGSVVEMKRATCGVCDPLLVSEVNEFRSLDWKEEYPSNICDCLVPLRVLSLKEQIRGMLKLIHLRSLKLFSIDIISSGDVKNICQLYHLQTLIFEDCNVRMIPREIKNLIYLRHLALGGNTCVEELPNEIEELINLRQLELGDYMFRIKLPQGLERLTSLRSLKGRFNCGRGGSKLGILNKLNSLGGELRLFINLDDGLLDSGGIVEDAREAELRTKIQLNSVGIEFDDDLWDGRSSSERHDSVRIGVLDALHPHPNLQQLNISYYVGSKLPMGWMVSPLNRLKRIW